MTLADFIAKMLMTLAIIAITVKIAMIFGIVLGIGLSAKYVWLK